MGESAVRSLIKSSDRIYLQLVQAKLNEENIPNTIAHANMANLIPSLHYDMEIQVPAQYYDRANAILSSSDIIELEHKIASELKEEEENVKDDEKYFVKAIFIFIIIFSLIVTIKYFKLF